MPDYMILQELKKLKVPNIYEQHFHLSTFLSSSGTNTNCVLCFQNTNYESIHQTAKSIAEQAHVLAYDPTYMSPFAQFACDNGLNVRGEI